jgi:hypothetical protein
MNSVVSSLPALALAAPCAQGPFGPDTGRNGAPGQRPGAATVDTWLCKRGKK